MLPFAIRMLYFTNFQELCAAVHTHTQTLHAQYVIMQSVSCTAAQNYPRLFCLHASREHANMLGHWHSQPNKHMGAIIHAHTLCGHKLRLGFGCYNNCASEHTRGKLLNNAKPVRAPRLLGEEPPKRRIHINKSLMYVSALHGYFYENDDSGKLVMLQFCFAL